MKRTATCMSLFALALTVACGARSHRHHEAAGAYAMAPRVADADEAGPAMSTESYDHIEDNPFLDATLHPLSTFASDVDTASYSNVRRFLEQEQMPPPGAVRIEELINYFSYDYAKPAADRPYSLTTEVGPAPWRPEHMLLHVGLMTRPIAAHEAPPMNLVFLLDVSGSMSSANKLPLLQRAMGLLVEQLDEDDRVSIVVYAGSSGVVLAPTAGSDRHRIMNAIHSLGAGGSTNGAQGIHLAYRLAEEAAIPGGVNRVILATDGDFNVGTTNQSELVRLIEGKRARGVSLSVLGLGMGNYKDSTLEKLADHGNGNYGYIDSIEEARKLLVHEMGATLVTVAQDVKLQVEFNPAEVAAYRLIGYENRLLRPEDFADDRKDAGDMGAGHSVTALYEIVPVGVASPARRGPELRYQAPAPLAPGGDGELLTVKTRYKLPGEADSVGFAVTVPTSQRVGALQQTSSDFRFSAAVAAFGMLLRDSPHAGQASYDLVDRLARGALGQDAGGYRRGFLGLLQSARTLDGKSG